MKLHDKRFQRIAIGLLASGFVALAAALKVSGCGWDYYTDHSVRFNGYRNATEFARLPRLPNFYRMNENRLFSWDEDVGHVEEDYDELEKRKNEIDARWDAAADAEGNGDLVEAQENLREYLNLTHKSRECESWEPKDVQSRRNSAFDRLDALTALDKGSLRHLVCSYLRARRAYDDGLPPEEVSRCLSFCRNDRNLQDNAAYLEAAVFYRDRKRIGVDSFAEVARLFPTSEKREAALFMSGITSMKSSRSSGENKPQEPDAALRDEDWELARRVFQQVKREYPNGRYFVDATGWLAYLWLKAGERANALADYYRMLASDNEVARAEAVVSIAFARHKANESEMAKLEGLIVNEPRTAMAYAYHEIYNYAVWHRCSQYEYGYGSDEKCKPQRATNELRRIATFATRMMARYPGTTTGGGFVLRVAEAQLELENNADASRLARRALALGVKADQRAEALWVAGAAEHRLRRYDTARHALETLVNENPNNRYAEGGRRLLAMLLEDSGNLEAALDVYLALDYRYDVAYFVDVLMTPTQLAAFIEKRPSLNHRDEMLYALGIRYLRDRRWRDAREVFIKIRTVGRNADQRYFYKRYSYDAVQGIERENPKERGCDPTIQGVRQQWIDQDIRTANDLETLERQVELAQGDEARAEALYQVASYQFERSLVFYNPIVWKGIRHYLLGDLDNDGFRQPGESQLLFNYMQKHDMASNSLPIFLEVVRRFPNTRAARDALFTAAVCHERLAEYNNYWRRVYSQGGHAGERMVTYKDVTAAYPKYSLPRGTLGWKPSTRTINGGPGWEPPPKPKPRPSRWARAANFLNQWMNKSFKLFNRVLGDIEFAVKQLWLGFVATISWVLHCLWVLTLCCWLWFLWRRAREARDLMNEALERCSPRPPETRGLPHMIAAPDGLSVALDKFTGQDLRDRVLCVCKDLLYQLRQICSDRRGRALIALYAATHGLFGGLLVRLLINW